MGLSSGAESPDLWVGLPELQTNFFSSFGFCHRQCMSQDTPDKKWVGERSTHSPGELLIPYQSGWSFSKVCNYKAGYYEEKDISLTTD